MVRGRIRFVLLSAVLLTVLVACGKDGVCFLGMGECNAFKNQKAGEGKSLQTGGGTAPTGRLSLGCNSWGQCWTYSEVALGLVVANASGTAKLQLHDGMPGEIVNNNAFYLKTTGKVRSRVRVLDSNITTMTQTCDMCDVDIIVIPKP